MYLHLSVYHAMGHRYGGMVREGCELADPAGLSTKKVNVKSFFFSSSLTKKSFVFE